MGHRRVVENKQFYEDILTKMLDPAYREERIAAVCKLFDYDRVWRLPRNVTSDNEDVILELNQLKPAERNVIRELFDPANQTTDDNRIRVSRDVEFNKFLNQMNFRLIPFVKKDRVFDPRQYSKNHRIWHEFIAPQLLHQYLNQQNKTESQEEHNARREEAIVLLGDLMLQADLHDDLWKEKEESEKLDSETVETSAKLEQMHRKLTVLERLLLPKSMRSNRCNVLCNPEVHSDAIPILKSLQSESVREFLRLKLLTPERERHKGIPTEQRLKQRCLRRQTFQQFGKTFRGIEDKVEGSTSQYIEFLTTVTGYQKDVFVLTANEFLASLVTVTFDPSQKDQYQIKPIIAAPSDSQIKDLSDNDQLKIRLSDSDAKNARPKAKFSYQQGERVYTLQQEVLEGEKAENGLQNVWTRLTLSSQTPQDAKTAADDFAFRIRAQILFTMGLGRVADTDKTQQQTCLQEHRLTITQLPADITVEVFTDALARAGFSQENITFRQNVLASKDEDPENGNGNSICLGAGGAI